MSLATPHTCKNHPESSSSIRCTICESFFCDECLDYHQEKPYCFDCIEEGVEFNEKINSVKGYEQNAVISIVLTSLGLFLFGGWFVIIPGLFLAERARKRIKFYPNLQGLWLVYLSYIFAVLYALSYFILKLLTAGF